MSDPGEVDIFWSSSVSSDFCTDVVLSKDSEIVAYNAPFNDLDANELNTVSNAGAVYIRAKSGDRWINEYKIVSPNREADGVFGHHLDFSGTRAGQGLVLAIAARGELGGKGRVYLYKEVAGVFTLNSTMAASDGVAGDFFGFSVSACEVNNAIYIIIGAPFATVNSLANAGKAYIFFHSISGDFTNEDTILNSQSDTELITNGHFTTNTAGWAALFATLAVNTSRLEVTNAGGGQGFAKQTFTVIVGQIYTVVVDFTAVSGVQGAVTAGSGATFGLDSSTTSRILTFTVIAISTSMDILMGNVTSTVGHQSIFDNASVRISQIRENAYFGYNNSIFGGSSTSGIDEGVIAISGREPDYIGLVRILSELEGSYSIDQTISLPAPATNDYFGVTASQDPATFAYNPISVNSDGTKILIGAHGVTVAGNIVGNATVWSGTPGNNDYSIDKTYLGSDILLDGETSDPFFGSAVFISGDVIVIGAQEFDTIVGSNNNRGTVYHAHLVAGTWGDLGKLPQPSINRDDDFFGYRVFVNDTYIAVAMSDFTGNVVEQGGVTMYLIAGNAIISDTDDIPPPVDFFLIDMTCTRRTF